MVLVPQDGAADLLALLFDGGRVVVMESLFLVPQPHAEGDPQPQALGLVEFLFRSGADAPGAEGIAAALGQQRLRPSAPGAANEERLAVEEQ